jgi:SAM-dependent methyltransferase
VKDFLFMATDHTGRFSNRVDYYIRSRPSYPGEMLDYLKANQVLLPASVIADIGSGTGISSKCFLDGGFSVIGIEPNGPMREASEEYLRSYPAFSALNGTAESTNLIEQSVDAIVCAQAFHWFDRQAAKSEFKRILKPEGYTLLIWNERRNTSSDFMRVYDDFVKMFGTDYNEVNHQNTTLDVIASFYAPQSFQEHVFENHQDFNFEGLRARVLSCSYMPDETHKDYEFMMYVLKKIFRRYQQDGIVKFEYDTKVYYGKL